MRPTAKSVASVRLTRRRPRFDAAGDAGRQVSLRTLRAEGVEALHMIGEGQVERLDGREAVGQVKFVESRDATRRASVSTPS